MKITFDNTYARELSGMYVPWHVSGAPKPKLRWLNTELANELGIGLKFLESEAGLNILAGVKAPEGAQPIAQAYAGHQFGHFSPQLGDGRALLLGEVIDKNGLRRDFAFKGSGRTPFSRGGDGKATFSSVLREVLISESMHALGIPTTRSLSAVTTGENIMRQNISTGGILARIASSHLRVGSFEFFAARKETEPLRRLANYAITRHDRALAELPDTEKYTLFLERVIDRQASLIAKWMGVGFIHGVMNTDNMTISGETIDYGPCAFMEAYDPNAVFSSIDTQGRYAYVNQPSIANWNLERLASALLPLLDDKAESAKKQFSDKLNTFNGLYAKYILNIWRSKLGLDHSDANDKQLAEDFLQLMQVNNVDFTQGWRSLVMALEDEGKSYRALFGVSSVPNDNVMSWFDKWQQRSATESADPASRASAMNIANPIYIPRNHLVEDALTQASEYDNLVPFQQLMAVLKNPYDTADHDIKFATPAKSEITANYKTFCGT